MNLLLLKWMPDESIEMAERTLDHPYTRTYLTRHVRGGKVAQQLNASLMVTNTVICPESQ